MEKTDLDLGTWATGKRMPKSAFPLRPNQAYRLGGAWTWRVISFALDGRYYRVLLAHQSDKQEFIGMLGRLEEGVMTVLCRIEHHGSHPGWHVHYQPYFEKQVGVVRGADEKRRDCGRGVKFGTDVLSGFDDWAISIAHTLFKLPRRGEQFL
jgi:hypothetical protein